MDNHLILPALYLPPISYFSNIQESPLPILLEGYEHFPKQTYRTRTSIYSSNGKLDLIVPIKHGKNGHTKMKDMRISNEANWQRIHWLGLQAAYRSSGYFEYYEDDFAPFYHQKYEWLYEYNAGLIDLLLRLLKIEKPVGQTESFLETYNPSLDFRQTIHPKKTAPGRTVNEYYQVFGNKYGFIRDLSIVDMLFNMGPESKRQL